MSSLGGPTLKKQNNFIVGESHPWTLEFMGSNGYFCILLNQAKQNSDLLFTKMPYQQSFPMTVS